MKMFLARPDFENNRSEVLITFEQALDIIKAIDNLTLGIKKIVYLVGWQGFGHDDCFPEMTKINEYLKRDGESAKESLYWLFNEAKKYNTVVSFHGNLADEYSANESHEAFVAANAIVNGIDGKPAAIEVFNGRDAFKTSYKHFYESGLFKKIWDDFCAATPVKEAGTVHLDNFCIAQSLNPYTSVDEENEARNKMLDYIQSTGIDVTSEYTYRELEWRSDSPEHPIRKLYETGNSSLPSSSFESSPIHTLGRIPATWWTSGMTIDDCMRFPPSLYSGRLVEKPLFKVFYGAIHGEEIWMDRSIDPKDWAGEFMLKFCTEQLPYFFLNRFERLSFETDGEDYIVHFSDGIVSEGKTERISRNGVILKDGGDVILPLDEENSVFIAYSKDGRSGRWNIPGVDGVDADVFEITADGKRQCGSIRIENGSAKLDIDAGKAFAISISGITP